VVSNPEFLKEGAAIEDFMRPDRIVLGTSDDAAGQKSLATMRQLYTPFIRNHDRILSMDVRSAEFTKYAANAMLATRISFMNELANLADKVGVDIEHVRKGIGSDPRIGYSFLYAGCGYGGSCFPKDVKALQRTAREQGAMELHVLNAVERANKLQKQVLYKKIVARFGPNLTGKQFALWGLAFKPNTDDVREAPSLDLIADLLHAGAKVCVYDPVAMKEVRRVLGERAGVRYAMCQMDALMGADALVIVTEWKEFRSPDFEAIRQSLAFPCIFDGRNLYYPQTMLEAGFEYYAIGRGEQLS
jgi:UDPglucose 6-dehydrogenase